MVTKQDFVHRFKAVRVTENLATTGYRGERISCYEDLRRPIVTNFIFFGIDRIIGVNFKQTLVLGQTQTLVFGVSGYPPLEYTWIKDGQQVTFGGRLTLNPQTGSVTFKPVQKIDEGNYTCQVFSNKLGGHTFDPISAVVIGKVYCEAFDPQYHQPSSSILNIKSKLKTREEIIDVCIFGGNTAVHQ